MDGYFPEFQKNIPSRLPGTAGIFHSHTGKVYYVYSGSGRNVLLIHSPGPGMSSYEWRDEYISLSRRFCVWAVDLPGFARSEKGLETYSAPVFISFIKEFIEKKINAPVIIAASGLSAAFAAMAAHSCPLVRGVLMSSPATSSKDYPFLRKKSSFPDRKSVSDFAAACVSPSAAANRNGMLDEMNACNRVCGGAASLSSYLAGRCDIDPSPILKRLSSEVRMIASPVTPSCLAKRAKLCTDCLSPHIDGLNMFENCLYSLAKSAF